MEPELDDEDQSDESAPQGEILELEDDPPPDGVIDTEDGGAVVKLEDESVSGAQQKRAFYDNLAGTEVLPLSDLAHIDSLLRPLIEADWRVREKRDQDYAEAIKLTGLGDSAAGAAFDGGSTAVHPVLAKAAVEYQSRAILELMPSNGPVKAKTIGKPTQQRVDKAERVARHMNWQFTSKMPEFRAELEQLLLQSSLAGSQFIYACWDTKARRPRMSFWPQDQVATPYSASSLLGSDRSTMAEMITQVTYEDRVSTKYYVESQISSASATIPDQTAAREASDKVAGVEPDAYNEDGLRVIWRCFAMLDLEGDPEADGLSPYVIELDAATSGTVLRVTRNWDPDDEGQQPLQWLIEFPFIPWRNALSIGLGQAIGRLAGAGSGALRALLDSALVNTFPGIAMLKGANVVGQSQNISIGTAVQLEGSIPGGDDDIRKLMMPLPYNQPSPVLQQLMGTIVQECEGFVRTTLDNITEDNVNQLPVGTVLSVLEEGLRSLNALFARQHAAMAQLLKVQYRLNSLYLDEQELKDETGEVLATREDYNGPMDIEPVSDPTIFTEAQRYAQMQLVAQRAQLLPQLYDLRAVEEMILRKTRIPDYDRLLLPAQNAQPNNAVNENVSLSLGRPVAAFPDQDHLAHIEIHLNYLESPFLGQNPLIAPKFLGGVLQHLAEHMSMWYVSEFYHHVNESVQATGQAKDISELMNPKNHEVSAELDRTLAEASKDVIAKAAQVFAKLPPIIQQAQQLLQQYQPQMPQDPTLAAASIQAQAKVASDQTRERIVDKQTQARSQEKQSDNVVKLRLAAQTQMAESERAHEANQVKLQTNREDNATAMEIAAAEIAAGRHSELSTGTGINPGAE